MDEQENPLTETMAPAPVEDVRDRFWDIAPKESCSCGNAVEGRSYPYADRCKTCRITAEWNAEKRLTQRVFHLYGEANAWTILGWE